MSEDEAINNIDIEKRIANAIKIAKEIMEDISKRNDGCEPTREECLAYSMQYVEKLLDLYNKEKEKNKFINDVKAIGTDDTVNVVLTKSQYEYLLERATNTFDKYEKCPNCKTNLDY